MTSEWAGSKMTERLVRGGADVHARFTEYSLVLRLYDEPGHVVDNVNALHMGSFRSNFVALEPLLAHHRNAASALETVSSCDSRGSTPLHWATRNSLFNPGLQERAQNIKTTIDLLLDIDPAMVNIRDIVGNTALHYAAFYFSGNGRVFMPVFETLCGKGADASTRNNQGETPLHKIFAIANGTIDKQILSLLVAHGAKINDIDHAGNTPPHVAVRRLDNHDAIDFLIEEGADATIGNLKNETLVHIAASGYVFTPGLTERVEMQNGVLAILTKAGGIELMDLPNAKGNTPRQICKAHREKWREDEEKKSYLVIGCNATSIEDLSDQIATPHRPIIGPQVPDPGPDDDPKLQASLLFRNLNYELEVDCIRNKSTWWFRTYEGHCNWLKKGESGEGSIGSARPRDYQQCTYADGISKPRDGPNPRAISNAFFQRKKKIYYDHTPLLLGLIEFIMHDVTYSQDSIDAFIEVRMPKDEENFPLNTTLRVPRTASMLGTGTSRSNPRENVNMATTWLDISSLYGSTSYVAYRLRSKVDGKLLTQEVQSPGTTSKASYLPFNTMGVPTNTRPGVEPEDLFAGGDPRTNEDWLLLGIHTLLLREHNRLCDILRKQKPSWDDEQLYQTVRLIMSAKHALIANAYQMAYWTEDMPWPRDDGFPLYRQMFGENALEINPANTYPWPLVTKNGKPMTVSAEMAVVYRFHEFIIPSFPIKDQNNKTLWEQNLFDTSFNSTGFLDVGLERILAGALSSHIPNFKSGVDESFRSAGLYRGRPFDIVVSSIVHEREQGLPTFNQYFRAYNVQDPDVIVPIRDTWDKFSSDPEVIRDLKKLYKHPDDVDLVVGCQLDEESFPGTTVPKSALIISLFSLFGMGNSDRFSIGFAMMRCILVDRPWDCHPSNALEDLIWEQKPVPGFHNFRFYSDFWVKELDLPAHGTNLLWRLITENSEINCVQRSPLFPPDNDTNPILCSKEAGKVSSWAVLFSFFQITLSLSKQGPYSLVATVIITTGSGILAFMHYLGWRTSARRKT
ncbi:hypothetical protein FANTH_4456 [Fusarium anthophilum]|uniref:Peroxidase n=1 Tax=Fusarium anthophilum TaxID=48485 RepID=A0A8H5E8A3_9HYPO|nr:hypothetical protein FANTH_4456 [Fusarium anthophilum]